MSDEKQEQVSQSEGASCCGPGCGCEKAGFGRKGKLAICLLVLAVAALVFARGLARKSQAAAAQAKAAFPTTLATCKTPPAAPAKGGATPARMAGKSEAATAQAKAAFPTTLAATGKTPPAAPAKGPATPARMAGKSEAATAQANAASATTRAATGKTPPAAPAKGPATPAPQAKEKPVVWGATLAGLADLNQVATQHDAVLVYLPQREQGPVAAVKEQIARAAGQAQAAGTKTACYTLDAGSKDYAEVTSQTPAPCVLAAVKGGSISVVSGEITEEKLLQAIVTASSPSGCSSSGCCASGCK